MSIDALAIHPCVSDLVPSNGFRSYLQDIEFIDCEFERYGTVFYQPGSQFFKHIVFQHSHPVIELSAAPSGCAHSAPRDSKDFCQIELETNSEPSFLCGINIYDPVRDPLCPTCKQSIPDWPDLVANWIHRRQSWECSACGCRHQACAVDWRHLAGLARYWITIRQIREAEAAPSDEFLQQLGEFTSCKWQYFWYHL